MKKQKGFTLIELLIVIAIIGILAGALLTIINPQVQQRKARDARIKGDLSKLATVAEGYNAEFGVYRPVDNNGKDGGSNGSDSTCWNDWVQNGHARGSYPKDPDGNDYDISCRGDDLIIRGQSDDRWFHYSSSDGCIHEGNWHWDSGSCD